MHATDEDLTCRGAHVSLTRFKGGLLHHLHRCATLGPSSLRFLSLPHGRILLFVGGGLCYQGSSDWRLEWWGHQSCQQIKPMT